MPPDEPHQAVLGWGRTGRGTPDRTLENCLPPRRRAGVHRRRRATLVDTARRPGRQLADRAGTADGSLDSDPRESVDDPDPQEPAPELRSDEADGDQFLWGPDVEPADPERTSEPDGPDPDAAPNADTGSRDESEDPGADDEVAALRDELETVRELVEDLRVAALNADLKEARDESASGHHEEIRTAADQIRRRVDCIEDGLDDLEPRARSEHGAGNVGVPVLPGRGPRSPDGIGEAPPGPVSRRGAVGQRSRRSIENGDGGGVVFGTARDGGPGADSDGAQPVDEPEVVDHEETGPGVDDGRMPDTGLADPGQFLLPGARLRDIWRLPAHATAADHDGENGQFVERWVVETTPCQRAQATGGSCGTLEFPPEVTEFALAPDEVPFEKLLEGVADEQ